MSFAGTSRSGIASRLRSSRKSAEITLTADSSEQSLPNINTPELADTAAFTDKKVTGKKKAPKMDVPRKSLRVQAKADPSSTMSKAVKRIRDKDIGCSSSTGNPLLASFPYHRLTPDEVSDLFNVYQIQLGHSPSDRIPIIEAIQQMDRSNFDNIVSKILQSTKQEHTPIRLTLDILDSTAIIVTSGDNFDR